MKRLVAVLLCMTMAVSITACGTSETENNKEINRKALALFVQPTKKDFMSMLERSTKKCMV